MGGRLRPSSRCYELRERSSSCEVPRHRRCSFRQDDGHTSTHAPQSKQSAESTSPSAQAPELQDVEHTPQELQLPSLLKRNRLSFDRMPRKAPRSPVSGQNGTRAITRPTIASRENGGELEDEPGAGREDDRCRSLIESSESFCTTATDRDAGRPGSQAATG